MMNNTEILQKLIEVLEQKKGHDGWTDLAVIGTPLNEIGINYRALVFLKLRELLEEYKEYIEIRRDDTSYKVPVLYAKQKDSKEIQTSKKVTYQRQNTDNLTDNLMQWAWMGDFREVVNDLKNMALKERWYYKNQNPAFPFPILSKYLRYTFYRLSKEGNKI